MLDLFRYIGSRLKPRRLLDSVTLVVMVLVLVQLVALGAVFSRMIYEIVEQQTEKRALQAAKHVALMPELKTIITNKTDASALSELAESIRLEAEATRIVITDRQAQQIFNTDRRQIGTPYLMPENSRALRYGRPSVTKSQNPQGGAIINGNAPIFDDNLNILGMVSVGYQVESVRNLTRGYLEKELFYIWIFITLGLVAAIYIARGVKRATFGLEPHEIAGLFQEREAIIASIREGIVATDAAGQVTLQNQAARELLGVDLVSRTIHEQLPSIDFPTVLLTGEQLLNQEIAVQGVDLLFSMAPIRHKGEIAGAVATFRRKDEIELMARELSQVQAYSDMLRAQTHEYSNRLHAIVGMIQMEAYDEVLDFIAEETTGHRMLVRQLTETVPDQILSAFLIGKYMHAQELKVAFEIDPETHMIDIPENLNRHQLVTVLGNVLNNAFEAAQSGPRPPQVRLFMTDFGHDLIFEIEDSGPGVPAEQRKAIFEKGVSSKAGEKRGYGLFLTSSALHTLGGGISLQESELGGALFIIEIPKSGRTNAG